MPIVLISGISTGTTDSERYQYCNMESSDNVRHSSNNHISLAPQ